MHLLRQADPLFRRLAARFAGHRRTHSPDRPDDSIDPAPTSGGPCEPPRRPDVANRPLREPNASPSARGLAHTHLRNLACITPSRQVTQKAQRKVPALTSPREVRCEPAPRPLRGGLGGPYTEFRPSARDTQSDILPLLRRAERPSAQPQPDPDDSISAAWSSPGARRTPVQQPELQVRYSRLLARMRRTRRSGVGEERKLFGQS
jgi:hypothetical protein